MSWIERRLPHFGVKPRRVCYLTIFCVLKLLLLSQLVSSSFQSQVPDALFLLYSPGGGEVSPQGAALRLLQPAKWHRPAPSSSQSQKPGRAELLRTAMAEVTAGCSESIFVLPQNTGPLCFLVFHCLSCTAKPLCSPLQLLALHPAGCSHSTAGCIVPPAGSAASKHPLQLCVTVRYGNYVNAPACVQCKPEL